MRPQFRPVVRSPAMGAQFCSVLPSSAKGAQSAKGTQFRPVPPAVPSSSAQLCLVCCAQLCPVLLNRARFRSRCPVAPRCTQLCPVAALGSAIDGEPTQVPRHTTSFDDASYSSEPRQKKSVSRQSEGAADVHLALTPALDFATMGLNFLSERGRGE